MLVKLGGRQGRTHITKSIPPNSAMHLDTAASRLDNCRTSMAPMPRTLAPERAVAISLAMVSVFSTLRPGRDGLWFRRAASRGKALGGRAYRRYRHWRQGEPSHAPVHYRWCRRHQCKKRLYYLGRKGRSEQASTCVSLRGEGWGKRTEDAVSPDIAEVFILRNRHNE